MNPAQIVRHVFLYALAIAVTCSGWPGEARAQTAKSGTGVISGTVEKLAGSAPIKGASVQLLSQDDHTRSVTTSTDAGGRFELNGIAGGRYRLRVSHDGFLAQEYGARKPGEAGATLTLRPAQAMQDLVFRMTPAAVIAGRVTNEDGEPLPWVKVTALREAYADGKRRLTAETMSPTNDLGEYRLFGLKPGRYFVSVDYKPGVRSCADSLLTSDDSGLVLASMADTATNPTASYVPTMYPSTVDPAKAIAVTVKAGEEISSIEITVSPTTAYTVRGRVLNMISRRPGSSVMLTLAPRNNGQSAGLPGRNMPLDGAEGPFAIANVLPGSYVLLASWFDNGSHYQAAQNVEVGNADLVGVNVFLAPGSVVRGHVTWDGTPSVVRDPLMLFLRETDIDGASGNATRLQAGGAFQLMGVFDGTYRVEMAGQSQDAYVESVRYGSADGLAEGFAVRRGAEAALEIVMSSKGGVVQGSVTDSDNLPAVGVWVVLVPNEPRRSEMQLYKSVTTDQNGHYVLRGIAPGDYEVFSWEDVELKAWEDLEFLRGFENRSEKVSVEQSEQKTVNLAAIRDR